MNPLTMSAEMLQQPSETAREWFLYMPSAAIMVVTA